MTPSRHTYPRNTSAAAPTEFRMDTPPHRARDSAEQLMYAWSMTASRAVARPEKPAPVVHEECPPEVYLG